MIDVKVIYTDNMKRFEIIRAYDGFGLYTSGKFKNKDNCVKGVYKLFANQTNWRVVGDVIR